MRWQGRRESDNVEDRRYDDGGYGDGPGGGGSGFPFPGGGGGGFQIPMGQGGGGGIGLIGIIVIVGIGLLLGIDPRVILTGGGGGMEIPGGARQIQLPRDIQPRAVSAGDDTMKRFVGVVLADTEDIWTKLFRDTGRTYIPPKLVLFRGGIQSGCGLARTQMGPFYCPTNRKVYIDLSFYDTLKRRFNAPGEFAQAYVIAHEVGHHVQNSLLLLQQVQRLQMTASATERNALQVRVELQADCFAGVWAKNTGRINKILEPGDIESALRAASAIGDDAIQNSTRGYAVTDSFTHGSSEQRVRWFKRGYDEGRINACETFGAQSL